jgi:hypothetical protein
VLKHVCGTAAAERPNHFLMVMGFPGIEGLPTGVSAALIFYAPRVKSVSFPKALKRGRIPNDKNKESNRE